MKKSFLFLVFILALCSSAIAAPTDLGQGLLYCRVHALPADLPTSDTEQKSALILDLRYADTNNAGAAAFSAWLGSRTAATPVFILVNAGTGAVLIHALAAQPAPPGVVTLGPALSGFTPDVTLNISPDTERRAYDAFEHGASAESLIIEKIGKPRYDEAAMVKDHVSDSDAPPDESSDAGSDAAKKPAPPPQLIDLALQRAVQLDRALLALHKISRG